jgi:hypothetical protein
MLALTFCLVLLILLCGAVLGGFAYLAKHPPVIRVDIGDVRIDAVGSLDASQMIPSELSLRFKPAPPDAPSWGEQVAPMPLEVLKYVDQESDDWARTARRSHARALFMETANWEHVLATLKREDGVVDEAAEDSKTE